MTSMDPDIDTCRLPLREGDGSPFGAAHLPSSGLSRRALLRQATAGLGLTWTLAACSTPEGERPRLEATRPDDDMDILRSGGDPLVAGEALDGTLLRRFYALRDFEPVWAGRPTEANALAAMVLDAAGHGMDPDLFQGGLLRRLPDFPPLRRELLLTHAVLTYAEALAFGAVPAHRRQDREDLSPEPVDVAAELEAALDGRDPVAAIEALAPDTPTYRALRRALREPLRPPPPRRRAEEARAQRQRLIWANLERQRWLPRRLPADRVWVNVPDQRLVLYRNDRPVFTTRVGVGAELDRKQSPEFHTVIEAAFFNPPWVIPPDIVIADILPRAERDPTFLARNNIVLLPNGEAEQAPGPFAGLGVIMFDMPNRFDVFLHDTPDRSAFERDNRRVSNGCIRVEKPLEFAALLMNEPLAVIEEKVATGGTNRKSLPEPVPIFLLYETAFASADGSLAIRPDFYDRDVTVWQRLHRHPPELAASARR